MIGNRNWGRRLVLLAALLAPAVAAAQGVAERAAAPATVRVQEVRALALTVSDMDRALAFYTGVLQFTQTGEERLEGPGIERLSGLAGARVRVARLRLGDERLQLAAWERPAGRAVPTGSRSNDLWFQHVAIIVGDMDRAYDILRANGVEGISSGPQRIPDWNTAAAGIRAYYFRDPDGHPLEILWFPPDKGDPKWQRPGESLFLGIDHTAIAVSDTEESLRFYRDVLGMRVAGESLNYGVEQERLSGVPGARVRITALRADSGPGVEFLEYLEPRDGRGPLTDQRPNDLVHWQTVMVTDDLSDIAARLEAAGVEPVAGAGALELPRPVLGHRRSLLVRDPSGHFVQLIEH